MGRYTYPTVSPPLSPSDEDVIAGIMRVGPEFDPTPPDVHIVPGLAGQFGNVLGLEHGDNEVDDIVASVVDSNPNCRNTNSFIGIPTMLLRIKNIHVFIVNVIISMAVPMFPARVRFLDTERTDAPYRLEGRDPTR
ncbi:unnamed protein product [Rhizoctonia solani]|uniref:Uncharacterized protein n=1 Tax=Rhizoctonia solani TaxID=456999 RepID=A0A8H3ANZ6_9AGAM|nr:unnamed protein product [Rhizoctonia solani]